MNKLSFIFALWSTRVPCHSRGLMLVALTVSRFDIPCVTLAAPSRCVVVIGRNLVVFFIRRKKNVLFRRKHAINKILFRRLVELSFPSVRKKNCWKLMESAITSRPGDDVTQLWPKFSVVAREFIKETRWRAFCCIDC